MKINVTASLSGPTVFGGPNPTLWTKECVIELTPKMLSSILARYITLDEKIHCQVTKYEPEKNLLIVYGKADPQMRKEAELLRKNGWSLTKEGKEKYPL